MKIINIYNSNISDLEVHTDDRGTIADIFYKANMNHACYITSAPNSIRGNHYHKFTTQHTFIVKGSMEYWHKSLDDDLSNMIIVNEGDFITSLPNEIHTYRAGPDGCDVIAFTEGPRGGKDYESDTIRVESIITNE